MDDTMDAPPADETSYAAYVRQKIDLGLAAAEHDDFISNDEIERRITRLAGE